MHDFNRFTPQPPTGAYWKSVINKTKQLGNRDDADTLGLRQRINITRFYRRWYQWVLSKNVSEFVSEFFKNWALYTIDTSHFRAFRRELQEISFAHTKIAKAFKTWAMLSKIAVFNLTSISGADHLALWSTATIPPSPEVGAPELRLVEGFACLQASCGKVYGNFSTEVHKSLWGARLELEQADESLDNQVRMNLSSISSDFHLIAVQRNQRFMWKSGIWIARHRKDCKIWWPSSWLSETVGRVFLNDGPIYSRSPYTPVHDLWESL